MNTPINNLGEAFQFALRQREFEINQLTQRNNFFMIFQGVLISGLLQSQGNAPEIISFAVCLIGFVVSLFQIGVAAGSKYWQIRWERAALKTEIWLLEHFQNYPHVSNFFTCDERYLVADDIVKLKEINQTYARKKDPLTYNFDAIKKATREELRNESSCYEKMINKIILNKYSVSRIPIYVGISLTLFWFFLFLFTFKFNQYWFYAINPLILTKF